MGSRQRRCGRFLVAALGVAALATTAAWSASLVEAAAGPAPGIDNLPGVGNANGVAIDATGRIVTAGTDGGFLLARFKPNGALDKTFGIGGKVITKFGDHGAVASDLAIDSSGRIVAAGTAGKSVALARYDPNGILDRTFARRER